MTNSIKANIKSFRENEGNKGLSLQEVNRRLLNKFEKLIADDGNRVLVMASDIAGVKGKVALYVKTDGSIRKAVLEDICSLINIRPSDHYIMAEGSKFFLYEELGTVANSSGYRAVKVPYAEACWQPLRHVIVAYAFNLTANLDITDSYVINHIASRHFGDGLGNIEVVTQAENTACGKFIHKLMDENPSISYIYLSAKQAHILKHFKSQIRDLLSRIEDQPMQVGSNFILDDIRYEITPDIIQINCHLKHSNTYDNHMMIVIERSLYENS